jgi:hypothetical protein
MEKDRKGLIKISNTLYCEWWDIIRLIFKDFRPTHIEFRHWENNVWYLYGISNEFERVTEGEDIPQYDVQFTYLSNGGYEYKFIKCP